MHKRRIEPTDTLKDKNKSQNFILWLNLSQIEQFKSFQTRWIRNHRLEHGHFDTTKLTFTFSRTFVGMKKKERNAVSRITKPAKWQTEWGWQKFSLWGSQTITFNDSKGSLLLKMPYVNLSGHIPKDTLIIIEKIVGEDGRIQSRLD